MAATLAHRAAHTQGASQRFPGGRPPNRAAARGADVRVRGQHEHVLDPQLGPRDLSHHRDEPLTDLSRRSMNLN